MTDAKTRFELSLLPAVEGDCLLLSWGDGTQRNHMVVDGGRASAYGHLQKRLSSIAQAGESLALYVLTHVDADHIAGALSYVRDTARLLDPETVWYNGFDEMGRAGVRSEKQGDAYTRAITKALWPLNTHFKDGIAAVENAPDVIDICGLAIRILSPDAARLSNMHARWTEWRRKNPETATRARNPMPEKLVLADLVADGETDSEPPNGSSIAFIAEWRGHRILFTGDAHPDLLQSSLAPLAREEGGRYRIDLLKVSHHGSKKNTTRALVELLDCKRFAFSTNGSLHGHPDPESVARLLMFSPPGPKQLYFNYKTARTAPWDDKELKAQHNYHCRFPESGPPGMIQIDVASG